MIITRTLRVKLDITPDELVRVRKTISEISQAYAKHVDYALTHQTIAVKALHAGVYHKVRTEHPELPTGLIQSVRDAVRENLKAVHSRHPKKKWKVRPEKSEYSSVRYDARTITLRGEQLTFSSIGKRVKTIISIPEWFKERYPQRVLKAATLRYDKKSNSLFANLIFKVETPEPVQQEGKIVGLDRGLYTLVSTSEGEHYTAREVRAARRRYAHNRRVLQQKGTPSAKRHLRKLSGKEKRFMRDTNHVISKKLASNPAVSTYVLEDLTNIRSQRRGKKMNTWLSQWSFHQLENFLQYKCEAMGKRIVFVDPRYTSQQCNGCGIINKKNRSKNKYVCSSCGVIEHADTNAAKNIRDKHILSLGLNSEQVLVNEPIVTSLTA